MYIFRCLPPLSVNSALLSLRPHRWKLIAVAGSPAAPRSSSQPGTQWAPSPAPSGHPGGTVNWHGRSYPADWAGPDKVDRCGSGPARPGTPAPRVRRWPVSCSAVANGPVQPGSAAAARVGGCRGKVKPAGSRTDHLPSAADRYTSIGAIHTDSLPRPGYGSAQGRPPSLPPL